jgi:hypothetical protein
MAVRLSALSAGRPLPPGRFLVLISVRGWVNIRAIVRLEGLGQLKNPTSSSGIGPAATFPLVAYIQSWKEIRHFVSGRQFGSVLPHDSNTCITSRCEWMTPICRIPSQLSFGRPRSENSRRSTPSSECVWYDIYPRNIGRDFAILLCEQCNRAPESNSCHFQSRKKMSPVYFWLA